MDSGLRQGHYQLDFSKVFDLRSALVGKMNSSLKRFKGSSRSSRSAASLVSDLRGMLIAAPTQSKL